MALIDEGYDYTFENKRSRIKNIYQINKSICSNEYSRRSKEYSESMSKLKSSYSSIWKSILREENIMGEKKIDNNSIPSLINRFSLKDRQKDSSMIQDKFTLNGDKFCLKMLKKVKKNSSFLLNSSFAFNSRIELPKISKINFFDYKKFEKNNSDNEIDSLNSHKQFKSTLRLIKNVGKSHDLIKKSKSELYFVDIHDQLKGDKEHEIKKCEITSSKFHHLFVIKKRGKIIKDDSKIK